VPRRRIQLADRRNDALQQCASTSSTRQWWGHGSQSAFYGTSSDGSSSSYCMHASSTGQVVLDTGTEQWDIVPETLQSQSKDVGEK
jgi:hypothetical protein